MRSFKLLITSFACLSMMVQTAFAEVKYDRVKLQRANGILSVDVMEDMLKGIFTTQEDQRKISYEFVKLRKFTEKWDWRVEVQGDSLAFRVNGKIQAYMKPEPGYHRVGYINGTKIAVTEGMSFLSFINKVDAATKNTAFNLESLFIQEAEAGFFLPFLIGGVFGTFLGLSLCQDGAAQAAEAPQYNDEPLPTPDVVEEINSCPTGRCGGNNRRVRQARSCTPYGRRYTRVSPFTSQEMFRSARNFCDFQRARQQDRGGSAPSRSCFQGVEDCVRRKAHRPQNAFGNNLSREEATQICQSIYNEIHECLGGRQPTPQPQPQPQDPGIYTVPEGTDVVK